MTRLPRLGTLFASLSVITLTSGCLALNGLSGYQEFSHDGRIYVLSRPETIASFKASHEVQYGVTKIGKGPNGETVVVEADAKDPWLQNALWKRFCERRGMK